MYPAAMPGRDILQVVEGEKTIFASEDTRCLVVVALDEMQRLRRYHESRKAGHEVFLMLNCLASLWRGGGNDFKDSDTWTFF